MAILVGIITYNRPREIRQVIAACRDHLQSAEPLHFVISDDCSPGDYRVSLRQEFPDAAVLSTPKRGGWGANANYLISHLAEEAFMLIEDDYVLQDDIDLDPLFALIKADCSIGSIRLDGYGGHHFTAHLKESDISAVLPNYRQGTGLPGRVNYWQLDPQSPELYLYSNRPAIRHRRFYAAYGLYPEGRKLGETETAYAHMVKDKMMSDPDAPCIALPLPYASWEHIGISYQHTAEDIGSVSPE